MTDVIRADVADGRMGKIFAFCVVMAFLLAAVGLTLAGKDIAGGVSSLLPIGFLVDRFIQRRKSRLEESGTKQERPPQP